jgi:hypothetical protein
LKQVNSLLERVAFNGGNGMMSICGPLTCPNSTPPEDTINFMLHPSDTGGYALLGWLIAIVLADQQFGIVQPETVDVQDR